MQATQTASTLFQAAVLADARDFLWDTAFPRYQAAGQMAPFLDCLIPHVLDGRLTALSPEVVQVCCSHIIQSMVHDICGPCLHVCICLKLA